MFSKRDLYPNYVDTVSTGENTVPELAEQVMYAKGEDQGIIQVMTKKDRTNLLLGILVILAILFAFGIIK